MYDPAKIEESVLALLGVFEFDDGRVWKKYDFDVMRVLHEKGLITTPVGKAHSLHLTEEGLLQAKEAALRLFGSVSP